MDDEGFIGFTKSLSPKILLRGYSEGCFPWSESPARWYCPNPRAVFDLSDIHFSRRLKRLIRQERFRVTYDQAFTRVMRACATVHGSSWIGPKFIQNYTEFHRLGFAHSVEVWEDEELVGGLYGVHLRRMFCGESMFHKRPNASKVAFYYLVQKLKELGVELFDSQVMTPHTKNLGARDMPREEFLQRVKQALAGEGEWTKVWTKSCQNQ